MLELTNSNFESKVLQNNFPVLVLWGMNEPMSNQIAIQMMKLNSAKVQIGKIDIDISPDLAMKFSIRQIPFIMLFVQGMVIATDTTLSDAILKQVM